MKFFVPLALRRREGKDAQGVHLCLGDRISGPHKDIEAVKKAIAALPPKNEAVRFLVLDGEIIVRPELEKRKHAVGSLISQDVRPIWDDGIHWRLSKRSWWEMW